MKDRGLASPDLHLSLSLRMDGINSYAFDPSTHARQLQGLPQFSRRGH